MQLSTQIRGYIVGAIWWPMGAECFKEFTYDVSREETRMLNLGARLREHCLAITQDGDFQDCAIAQGEILVTRRDKNRCVTRSWPLNKFPSIADLLHEDPDWAPIFEEG